eukprot:COSAG05_NODE_508_length_9135_cov_30.269780_3_plen_99_part_00
MQRVCIALLYVSHVTERTIRIQNQLIRETEMRFIVLIQLYMQPAVALSSSILKSLMRIAYGIHLYVMFVGVYPDTKSSMIDYKTKVTPMRPASENATV